MKKLFAFFAVMALSGCAVESVGLRTEQLSTPRHLRVERTLDMTFPEIQMALFKHEEACGPGPVFKMKEGQTSLATITEHDTETQPWNQVILFDLMWLQPSLRFDTRTRVNVYSFYSDRDVKKRIAAIFNAISKPEQCAVGEDTVDEE